MAPSTAAGSAAPASGNAGRIALAVVLAVLALAFLTFTLIMTFVPAGSLPGWLGHEMTPIVVNTKVTGYVPSTGHHVLRAVGSLIAAVVFAIGAWFSLKYKRPTITAAR